MMEIIQGKICDSLCKPKVVVKYGATIFFLRSFCLPMGIFWEREREKNTWRFSFQFFHFQKTGFGVNYCERNKIDWISFRFHFLAWIILHLFSSKRSNHNIHRSNRIDEEENEGRKKRIHTQTHGMNEKIWRLKMRTYGGTQNEMVFFPSSSKWKNKRNGSQKTNYSENQKLSIQSSFFPSFRVRFGKQTKWVRKWAGERERERVSAESESMDQHQ